MNLLKSNFSFFIVILMFLLLGPAQNAFAESTINCHCFQSRSYDPNDKFSADDYILATSFNSLLAKSFDISKKQVVMLKMDEGVSQDDLLVGLKITQLSGGYLEQLLGLRRVGYTWLQIISGMEQQEIIDNDKLVKGIRSGMPVYEAGARVADEMIEGFYKVPAEEVKRFRAYGLGEKEMALVFILAHFKNQKPEIFVGQYKKQGSSWSQIAFNLGIEPAAAGKLIMAYPAKQINN
jgi:hypothetical protein